MESRINQFEMKYTEKKTSTFIHTSTYLILYLGGFFFLFFICQACQENKKPTAPPIKNRDSLAVLETENVTTLISDSGITKYRIRTKSWDVYDRTKVPRWTFEKGLLLEQFDQNYKVNATIEADTAYYYTLKRVWELRGNVKIKNTKGDRFYTSQLFWDQDASKIYSKKKIRIEQADKIINGVAFESNQEMTIYKIYNTVGQVSFDEKKLQSPASQDTTQVKPQK